MQQNKQEVEHVVSRMLPRLLMFVAVVGFLASFILTIDTIKHLKNPAYDPVCNISPLISCGSVMATDQAEVLGFPNPLIGVVGFTMLGTIAFAMFAGARFKRWFWLTLNTGLLTGVLFVHWLIFQSVFVLESLCPYCMVSWAVIIPGFWYVTIYNLVENNLNLTKSWRRLGNFAIRHHFDIVVVWLLAILVTILIKFWYYWSTLL